VPISPPSLRSGWKGKDRRGRLDLLRPAQAGDYPNSLLDRHKTICAHLRHRLPVAVWPANLHP
jgi:hypothetical protein